MAASIAASAQSGNDDCELCPQNNPSSMVEFPKDSRYSKHANAFVCQAFYRARTGWRRDEWADSPLFICGKNWPDDSDLKELGRVAAQARFGVRVLAANFRARRQIFKPRV